MSKRIFLTGSHGFVGSHLLPKLIEQGDEVETDMRYLFTKKYECVIHLAGKNNIKNEFDAGLIESNIILTREIFKVNTRIVYASSCVAKYPLNPYAYSKLYAEHLGSIHGNALGLRFHNIYGNGNSKGIVWFLMQQKDGAKITIRGPELIRDYIDVNSIVDEIIKNIDRKIVNTIETVNRPAIDIFNDGVIDVGTGVGTRTIDLVSLYTKLSGKKFEIETIPPDASEPASMISNNPLAGALSLEEGLKGMLKKELGQPVLSDIYNHVKNNK